MNKILKVSLTVAEANEIISQVMADRHCLETANVEAAIENVSRFSPENPEPFSLSRDIPPSVLSYCVGETPNLIAAIKEIRAITFWYLKESKDYVEYIRYSILGYTKKY